MHKIKFYSINIEQNCKIIVNLINLFFQWIASLLQSDPSIVWMEAQEWLGILEKATDNKMNELVQIIAPHYFKLVGEAMADIDGGQSFVRISIPLNLHDELKQLRDT